MADYQLHYPGGHTGAIRDLKIRWAVNEGADLALGSACTATLEAQVYDLPRLDRGTPIECHCDGTLLGTFLCTDCQRSGGSLVKLTAADAMIRFDRDITGFLASLTFPVTAQTLLEALCDHCGVGLAGAQMPDLTVGGCTAQSGKALLKYLGQAAGVYFRVNAQGELESGWYEGEPAPLENCLLGSLELGTPADPIDAVLIRANAKDPGVRWPEDAQNGNLYIIQGNPLLTLEQDMLATAKRLYGRLKDYRCTPMTCALLPDAQVLPGDLIQFVLGQERHLCPVMELTWQNGRRSIRSRATASMQSAEAFRDQQTRSLPGRMFLLEQDAQTLQTDSAAIRGQTAALALQMEGMSRQIADAGTNTGLDTRLGELEQKLASLAQALTQLQTGMDDKAGAAQLAQLSEHIRLDDSRVTLLQQLPGMRLHIGREQVAVNGGFFPTAVITPQSLQAPRLEVSQQLDLGDFSLIRRTGGNLSLRYTAQ